MIHEDWLSIYGEHLSPSKKNTKFTERSENFGNGDIYVYRCEFNKCKIQNSNGGAIFISSSEGTKFLLEKSLFFYCQTFVSGSGGAIYFGDDGNCTLIEVCGYSCCSSDTQAFSFIGCTNNANYKNYMKDSSVSYCSNTVDDAAEIIVNYFGDDLFSRVNASNNKCGYNSGCWFYPSISSNECPITCSLSYCSFVNNTAHNSRVVSLSMQYSSKNFIYCNSVNNRQNDLSYGIFYIEGNIEIKYSCILGNIAKYTFYENIKTNMIMVSNCTLDIDIESKKNEYVVIKNIVPGSYTLALFHLSTGNCEADHPFKHQTFYLVKKRPIEEILRSLTFVIISYISSKE